MSNRKHTPFTFSQSSLQDYSECRRRFQLRYIDELNWPAVDSEPLVEYEVRLNEGRTFHRLVQRHLTGLSIDQLSLMANTTNLKRWWANYARMDFSFSGQTLQTELTLACKVGDHRIVAAYDLVAVSGGITTIYDWKTSARHPKQEWLAARWQTRVYPALLARSGMHLNDNRLIKPESIQMIYWFAEYPDQATVFKYSADKYTADWSAIQDLVEEITSASDFPLTQEIRSCAFCRYRSYCGRGDRAGNWVDADPEDDIGDFHDLEIEEITGIDTLNLNTT